MQRRVAGALRVVLVRERRAEQRHDAVARVLVHRPFEAVHAVGEDGEEPIHDAVPVLGVDLLGERHRALHVGEEDGHLLALALHRRARRQDPLGEMARRVSPRIRRRLRGARRWRGCLRRAALLAELRVRPIGVTAGGAEHRPHL